MQTINSDQKTKANSGLLYVAILSFTLFVCPLAMFGIARIFALEQASIGYQDIVMFAGYWGAAILVWTRFKFMWLIAVVLLGIVVGINASALFTNVATDNGPVYITQFILSIGAFSGVLMLADHLNTKTFDRRDQFSVLGAATRYVVSEPGVLIDEKNYRVTGTVTSLSFSGAMFEASNLPHPFYLKGWRFVSEGAFPFKASTEIIEISGNKMRIRFVNVNPLTLWKLNKHLKANHKA